MTSDFQKVKMKATAARLAGHVPEAHWDELLSEIAWTQEERLEIMRLARMRLAELDR